MTATMTRSVVTDNLPPHTERERRRAALLARRGTPEWDAAGRALQAERDRERHAEAAAVAREMAERARAYREPTAREVAVHVRRFNQAMEDARGDFPDCSDDDLAYALIENLTFGLRPELAAAIRREVL
jgi:hypothetical protein